MFSQWLLDALVVTPTDGTLNRARFRVLSVLRQFRLQISDPLVCFRLGKLSLALPLSHQLPLYRRAIPQYSSNLGRVAVLAKQKYPGLTMIDVGANIGDSVAMVRACASFPILCVEGEAQFFKLLKANTSGLPNIELENAFLGAAGDRVKAVHVARGTAWIELGPASDGIPTHTLAEAISRHPSFNAVKFLKLDAEGFDCRIISCESQFLVQNRPVLFFEYHPPLASAAGYDPFPVFGRLRELGYSVVMIYENTGRYLLTLELDRSSALEDLHHYFAEQGGFCDIAAFHAEDSDIAKDLRNLELGASAGREPALGSEYRAETAHAV
jgi:FkbM family methyltransferase